MKQLDQRIKYRAVIKENSFIKKAILDFLYRPLEDRKYIQKHSQAVVVDLYFMNMHLTINILFYFLQIENGLANK